MDTFIKNTTVTLEENVKTLSEKIDADTLKIIYSGLIAYLGYITFGLYGAALGAAAYFVAAAARIKAALWPFVAGSMAYSMGRRELGFVLFGLAALLYVRATV